MKKKPLLSHRLNVHVIWLEINDFLKFKLVNFVIYSYILFTFSIQLENLILLFFPYL